jgi:hypothetical protein
MMRTVSDAPVSTSSFTARAVQDASRRSKSGGWRYLVGAVFSFHGLIHIMGFAATWQLGQFSAVSRTPMVPSGLAGGSMAVLLLGVLWLVAALAFLAAAVGVTFRAAWWRGTAFGAALLSLLLCLAWWHDAWFGAVIDLAILAGLAVFGWLPRPRNP